MKKIMLIFCVAVVYLKASSQSVAINNDGSSPSNSAMLDIKSSTKGILIPRTSTSSRVVIPSPAKGLLVFDTTSNNFWFHDGLAWIEIPFGKVWGLAGNNATNPLNNFLGTTDNQPLRLRLNNKWAGELNPISRNYLLGDSAGASLQSAVAKGNIAIGSGALRSHVFANGTIAIGDSALTNANQNATLNTAIGYHALQANLTGQTNTAVGYNTLALNPGGHLNTAIGYAVLSKTINNGNSNAAVGANAMSNSTTSTRSAALGALALNAATSINNAVAIGYNSMGLTSQADHDIAIGYFAMYAGVGGNNIAIGPESLQNIAGDGNVAVGALALQNMDAGARNTAIGNYAMKDILGGYDNTAVGNQSVVGPGNINNATAIGSGSKVICSNCLSLGGDNAGYRTKVGINNSNPFTDLHIIQQSDNGADKTRGIRLQRSTGTNQWRTLIDPNNNYIFEYNNGLYAYIEPVGGTFVSPSDARLKKNIQPLEEILAKLLLLRPATYEYTLGDAANTKLTGFIAQDVEKIFPGFVHTGQDGYKGIAYQNFGIIAVKAIQEQQQLIEALEKKNEELEKRLTRLEKK